VHYQQYCRLTVTPKVLRTITIAPTAPSVPKGLTQQFTAIGTYSDATGDNPLTGVTWASSSANVTIDASTGLATAATIGTSNITASKSFVSSPTITSNTAVMTVTAAAIVSIAVTPAVRAPTGTTIPLGRTQQFTATATYTDNTTGDITPTASWLSSDTTIADIGLHTGLAVTMGKTTGTTNITASAPKSAIDATVVTSPAAVLTVGPKVVDSIAVTPNAPSIAKGRTQQFTATPTYSNGDTTPAVTCVWASSDTSKATIDVNGLATSLTTGNTGITAACSGVTSNTAVLNITGAVLDSIAVTPLTPSVAKGRTHQFMATGTYSDTSTADLTNLVTWTSGTPATAAMVPTPVWLRHWQSALRR